MGKRSWQQEMYGYNIIQKEWWEKSQWLGCSLDLGKPRRNLRGTIFPRLRDVRVHMLSWLKHIGSSSVYLLDLSSPSVYHISQTQMGCRLQKWRPNLEQDLMEIVDCVWMPSGHPPYFQLTLSPPPLEKSQTQYQTPCNNRNIWQESEVKAGEGRELLAKGVFFQT